VPVVAVVAPGRREARNRAAEAEHTNPTTALRGHYLTLALPWGKSCIASGRDADGNDGLVVGVVVAGVWFDEVEGVVDDTDHKKSDS
jgi:hypothetical protein